MFEGQSPGHRTERLERTLDVPRCAAAIVSEVSFPDMVDGYAHLDPVVPKGSSAVA